MASKMLPSQKTKEVLAKALGVLAASLSTTSLVSLLTDSDSRAMIFGGEGVNVSGIVLVSFLCGLLSYVAGWVAFYCTMVRKQKDDVAFVANLIGAVSSGLTLIYFAEKDADDKPLPFKWGHGTSIASTVIFAAGALFTKQ